MRKFKRVLSLIIMFALTLSFAFGGRIAGATTVKASTVLSGSTLTIKGFVNKGTLGTVITVPKGADNITIEIKDPHGKKVTEFEEDTTEHIKFVATKLGYYTVQYFVNGDFTRSQIYTIKIEGDSPTIEFEENSKVYIPDTISSSTKVILPSPIVTKANGEKLTYTLKKRDDSSATSNDVVVSVKAPIIDESLGDYANVTLTYDDDGNVVFAPYKDADGKVVYGTYTVCYTYQDGNMKATKYATIKVEEGFEDVISNIKMTFVWSNSGSIPTSGNLGSEIVLPRPVAQDKSRSNQELQSYTQVKVQFIDENGVAKDYVFDYTNFSFIPMDSTANGGYYKVEYTISNYYGVDTITRTYEIRNVTDKVSPDIYIVNEYTQEQIQNGTVDLTDVSYKIPNRIVVSYDGQLVIPALYAIDNFENYENLTLRRYWKTEDRTITLDNDTFPVNKNLVLTDESMDEYVKNCLKTPGTYTLRYEARDKSNSSKYIDFTIVVMERNNNAIDALTPEIDNLSLTKTTYAGEKVTFKVPSVADYMMIDGQKVTGTERCLVEAGYYIGNNYADFLEAFKKGESIQSYIDSGEFKFISKDKDNSNYYSFDVPNLSINATIYVVVRATDNAKYGMPNDTIAKNNISVKEGKIRLINIDASSITPPSLVSAVKSSAREFGQKELIDICELSETGKFVFAGENADFTKVSVAVYDPNGKEVTVKGLATTTNSTKTQVTLKKATFTSTRDGEYIIVISATDIANNSTVVAYKITVNDTIAPVINEIDEVPTTMVVGKTIEIPSIIVFDNGVEIENLAEEEISFEGFNDNLKYDFTSGDNLFTPHEIGTYTFKYIASDGVNKVELIKTIEVVADTSTDGKLYLDDSNWNPSYPLIPEKVDGVETGKYNTITLPRLQDKNAKGPIESYKVTVVGPNGKEMKVTEVEGGFSFEPSAKDGVYTVTYTVKDSAGQTVTLEKTIKVGDTVNPKLTINNEKVNLPTSAKLDSTLTINADDIVYSDGVSSKSDMTVVVSIKDTNGNVTTLSRDSSSSAYTYKFEKAGSYTLTYTVTDKAGNSTTKSTEIVVNAQSATEKSVTTIWGIVLIAISVAFLLGVVVYFVVTNKKAKPSKEKTKQNAKILE